MASKNVILKDKAGNQLAPATIAEQVRYNSTTNVKQAISQASGHATTANTAADMTDTTRIYVYTGSESGYTAGNWYYYDGSAWVSGGQYTDGVQFETDTTLSVSGKAADAEVVGDELNSVKEDLTSINALLNISDTLIWSKGYITSENGGIHAQVNNKWQYYSSLIYASDFTTLIVKPSPTRQIKIAKYDKDTGAWVETDLWTSDVVTLDNTYSIRVCVALLSASATEVTQAEQTANVSIFKKTSGDMSDIPVVESVYVQVGGATSASNKYVKATGIDLKIDDTITAKDGYQFAVYNSGNSQISGGWQSAFTMTANASGATIVIRKTGGVGAIDKENEGLTLYSYIVENYKSTGNRAFIINDSAVNDLVSRMPVNNRWKGKKAAFVGDSITYGVHTTKKYYDLLNAEIGFSSVYADGVEGSGYSTAGSGGHTPIVDRTANIPTDCDLVVVFAGTNDFGHGAPLGTIADNTDVSFYGAMIKTITDIITAIPSARLVIMTPLHRTGTTYMSEDDTNTQGLVLADYVEAEKKVAELYSIPVIDLWSISGLAPRIPIIKTTYMSDGLHPDTAGHILLAERILPILNDM